MGDLIDFAMRVKEQFDRANRKPEWSGVIRQIDSSREGWLDLLHTHLQAIAGRGAINHSVVSSGSA